MVSDCGQHHALVSMSFNPSPQGDGGGGAWSSKPAGGCYSDERSTHCQE